MKNYSVGEFSKLIGVSIKTLQNWDRDGILVANRTPTNRRFYTEEQLDQYRGSQSLNVDILGIINSDDKSDSEKLLEIKKLVE